MPVLLRSEIKHLPVTPAWMKKTAAALLRHAGRKHCELSILLVDDSRMTELNSTYRGLAGPTNVLSFPMAAEPVATAPQLLGDIVISVETAAREAADCGRSVEDYLCILLVHGLVHLLGYDHERGADDAAAMTAMEKELLCKISAAKVLAPLSE
ncbi:MAG: rRNA maturation RNase YbeY [Thermodesulfobacteriota bacterium]